MHSPIKRKVLQLKINAKKLKPGLVAFYDIRPGNGVGLFSREKSEEKRISGEAHDVNKTTKNRNQGRITPRSPHRATA